MSVAPGSIRNVAAPPFSPDAAQEAVLEHRNGALLVTGGPGTGKTSVLIERFVRLVEGDAEPERVALVLRSRRARDSARASVLERLAVSLPGLQVLTAHGLAYRVLKAREGEPPQVLSAPDQFAKVRELLATQDPVAWPAYGALLQNRGFADEVRQLIAAHAGVALDARPSRRGRGGRRPERLAGARAVRARISGFARYGQPG